MSFWFAITAVSTIVFATWAWRRRRQHTAALRLNGIRACREGVDFAEQIVRFSNLLSVHPLLLTHLDQQMVQAQLTMATLDPADTAFAQRLRVVRNALAQLQSSGHEETKQLCALPRTDKQHLVILTAIRKQRQLGRAARRSGLLQEDEHAQLDAQLHTLQVEMNISSVEQRATVAIARGQYRVAHQLLVKGSQLLARRTDPASRDSYQRLIALYRQLPADPDEGQKANIAA
ncbi:hypothetical protein Fbal_1698 [Ferrimonas balearica DSM 9799]|uniref:Uncharacterized protein n=1 Tax=Ferrimonas balearica (strain DSM 9799 / CCM 4581 / KCTC 23876 / PAT) TaxID=550540 RepID=E1SRF1_FERBD|nr:hypothetical protein [Ferrimonas balearica]ADN75902.1 hypothetical protein Fbal_1698 [Ferrimonas balearica DSM 9799]